MGSHIPGCISSNDLYTSEELASRLGVGINTQREWRRDGLKAAKVGRRLYYLGSDVIKHIRSIGRTDDEDPCEPANGEQVHAVVFREGNVGFPFVMAVGTRSTLEDAIRRLPDSWRRLVTVVEVKGELTAEGLQAAVDRLHGRVRVTMGIADGEITVLRSDSEGASVTDRTEIITCDRATGQQISEDDARWFIEFWRRETSSDVDGYKVVDVDAFNDVIQFCLEMQA